jgi:hypothetical protein
VAGAGDHLFQRLFTGEEAAGERAEEFGVRHERRNAPTSLILRELFCATTQRGSCDEMPVNEIPRGNPGEAQPCAEGLVNAGLEHSTDLGDDSRGEGGF